MRHLIRSIFVVLLITLLGGCDQGPPGPQGPQGPPGDPAVISFTVDFLLADADFNGSVASVAYDAPEITRRVVREGAVMAYFREQETWTALPYTYGVESEDVEAVDYTVTLGYAYEEGFLEVFYEASYPGVLEDLPDQTIKVVVLDSYARARAADVDLSDYEAVRSHYGLDE